MEESSYIYAFSAQGGGVPTNLAFCWP